MAHRPHPVADVTGPECLIDLKSLYYLARCSRWQWWWCAEVMVSQKLYEAPAVAYPEWRRFVPHAIDMLQVNIPENVFPFHYIDRRN